MMCLVARVALIAGLLSPVTGVGILIALAHATKSGTDLPPDVATIGMLGTLALLIGYSVLFAALPAALLAGIGFFVLVTLRARGLSPPTLLALGAVLGAGGVILVIIGVFGNLELQNPYVVAGAPNGAMWGLLVARHALTDRRGRPASE